MGNSLRFVKNSVQHPVMVGTNCSHLCRNCVLEQSILATPTFWYKQVVGWEHLPTKRWCGALHISDCKGPPFNLEVQSKGISWYPSHLILRTKCLQSPWATGQWTHSMPRNQIAGWLITSTHWSPKVAQLGFRGSQFSNSHSGKVLAGC